MSSCTMFSILDLQIIGYWNYLSRICVLWKLGQTFSWCLVQVIFNWVAQIIRPRKCNFMWHVWYVHKCLHVYIQHTHEWMNERTNEQTHARINDDVNLKNYNYSEFQKQNIIFSLMIYSTKYPFHSPNHLSQVSPILQYSFLISTLTSANYDVTSGPCMTYMTHSWPTGSHWIHDAIADNWNNFTGIQDKWVIRHQTPHYY